MTGEAAVRPMTAAEYAGWLAHEIDAYAADLAASGRTEPEDARAEADRQLRRSLPDGLATRGMRILRVLDDVGEAVGVLWIGTHPGRSDAGWIYDVEIDEDRRREGFGRAAMLAAEQLARADGWTAIGLNVFGHNPNARALYDSLGYSVASVAMLKSLD